MTDTGITAERAAPALVELLPRVLQAAPAAVVLVDLTAGTVTYGNTQAVQMAPSAALPAEVDDWSDAAGLRDPDGKPLSATGSPLSRIARGVPADGEPVTVERWQVGPVPAREPMWVAGFPLPNAPGLDHRALVVLIPLAGGGAQRQDVGDTLASLRDRAVLATDVSFTITDASLPDGPLLWVNPAFTRITGYRPADVVGRNCRFLQGPATDRAMVDELRAAQREQRGTTVTVLNYRKDGTAFWNEVSLSPVFDGAGRLTNYVGVQSDVTMRVRAEREREAGFQAAARAQGRLTILAETSASLSATLDVSEALRRLASSVVPAFADWCAVDMLEAQGVRRVAVAHRDPARTVTPEGNQPSLAGPAHDPVHAVLETGQPKLFASVDGATLSRTMPSREMRGPVDRVGVTSGIVVPLRARSRVLGALTVGLTDPRRTFDEDDLQLTVELGRRAGLAVENARLYTREHDVAVALQRSMLPRLPDLAGLDVAAHYLAGSDKADVGGDWYDLVPLPDGTTGLAIGDVMGHDLTAAAAMGQLRSVLRSYAWEGHQPSEVLDKLDRLVQGLGMAQLATCVYARLEPAARAPESAAGAGAVLRWANAGHLPPVLLRPNGEVEVLRSGRSVLIGAPGRPTRTDAVHTLAPGSTVLLYTDGLIEDRFVDVDTGIARLCEQAAAHDPADGVHALCDRLLDGLLTAPRTDDAAVMAVRLTESWGTGG